MATSALHSRRSVRSATYLIGASTRLVAVGGQTILANDGMITYEGGILALPARFADGPPWQALRAVEGLRGLVGVDFLRAESGASIVVEINPRPTMPVVGLVRLLGTGALAKAWLASDAMDADSVMVSGNREPVVVFRHDGAVTLKENDR